MESWQYDLIARGGQVPQDVLESNPEGHNQYTAHGGTWTNHGEGAAGGGRSMHTRTEAHGEYRIVSSAGGAGFGRHTLEYHPSAGGFAKILGTSGDVETLQKKANTHHKANTNLGTHAKAQNLMQSNKLKGDVAAAMAEHNK